MQSRNSEWFSPMVMARLKEFIQTLKDYAVKNKKDPKKYQPIFAKLDQAENDLKNINEKVKKEGIYKIDSNGNPAIKNRELQFHDELDDPIISSILNTIKTQALELALVSKNLFKKDDGKLLTESLIALCEEFFNKYHRLSKTNLTIAALDSYRKLYEEMKQQHPISPMNLSLPSSTALHTPTQSISVSRSTTPPNDTAQAEGSYLEQVATLTYELDLKAKKEIEQQKMIEKLQQQLNYEKQQQHENKLEIQKEIDKQTQLADEIANLKSQKEDMDNTARELIVAYDAMENKLDQVQQAATEIKKQNDDLQNRASSLQNAKQEAEAKYQQASANNNQLQKQNEELQQQVNNLQTQVSEDNTVFKQVHQSLGDLQRRSTFSTAQRIGIAIGIIVGLGLLATGIGAVAGLGILAAVGVYAGIAAIAAGAISLGFSSAKGSQALAETQQQDEVVHIDRLIPKNRILSVNVNALDVVAPHNTQSAPSASRYSPRHFQPAPTEQVIVEIKENNNNTPRPENN